MPTIAEPTPRSARSGLSVLAVGLLGLVAALPAVYVLGSGPAHRLFLDGTLPYHTYKAMYEPFVSWVELHPPAEKAFYWYRGLFLRKPSPSRPLPKP